MQPVERRRPCARVRARRPCARRSDRERAVMTCGPFARVDRSSTGSVSHRSVTGRSDGAVGPAADDRREQARRRRRRGRAAARRRGTSGTRHLGEAHRARPRRCRPRRARAPRPASCSRAWSSASDVARVPARLGEHAGVLGPDHEDGVEPEHELRVVHRAQARGQRAGERLGRRGTAGRRRTADPRRRTRVTASVPGGDAALTRERRPERRVRVVLGEAERRPCPGCRGSPGRPRPAARRRRCGRRAAGRGRSWSWPGCPARARCTPLFIPMARVPGPAAHDHRADRHRRGEHAVDVELVGARRLDRGQHPRQVLGLAAGHHRVDRHLLDGHLDEVGRHDRHDLVGRAGRARRASAAPAPRSAARPAARRSSRGRTSSRSRPRRRPARCAATASTTPPNRTRSVVDEIGVDAQRSAAGPERGQVVAESGDAGERCPLAAAASRRCARPRRRRRRGSASAPSRSRGAS